MIIGLAFGYTEKSSDWPIARLEAEWRDDRTDGVVDDLQIYALFNSISIKSERWMSDYERLCEIEDSLLLKLFPSPAEIELRTAKSTGQRVTQLVTEAP